MRKSYSHWSYSVLLLEVNVLNIRLLDLPGIIWNGHSPSVPDDHIPQFASASKTHSHFLVPHP